MPGERVLESVRRSVSRWPLWELPRWLQALVACVIAVYCAATCAAVALTRVQASQLQLFAALVLCSAAAVELTRRVGEPSGLVRDVYAIWDLPAAILLPPVYALLAPIPRMALTQVRVRRTIFHRRAYTAAAVGLAYAAASLSFHALAPGPGAGAATGLGRHALLWVLLVAGCGLLRLVLNDGLVLAAVKGSAPETRLLREVARPEAVFGSVTELLLGTLAAFAAVHTTLVILCALPLVICLQHGVRHAQLLTGTWAAWFRLRPLWAMLLDGAPDVRLPPQPGTRLAARYRLHRRVIEIRDAQLALRPFRDNRAAAEAADAARLAGLTRDESDAVIEATLIVSALGARRSGAAPASSPDAGRGLPATSNDLESEAGRLLRVSRAVRRSPIVRRAAGAGTSRASELPARPRQPEAVERRNVRPGGRAGAGAGEDYRGQRFSVPFFCTGVHAAGQEQPDQGRADVRCQQAGQAHRAVTGGTVP
jgi:hypothetical protein